MKNLSQNDDDRKYLFLIKILQTYWKIREEPVLTDDNATPTELALIKGRLEIENMQGILAALIASTVPLAQEQNDIECCLTKSVANLTI